MSSLVVVAAVGVAAPEVVSAAAAGFEAAAAILLVIAEAVCLALQTYQKGVSTCGQLENSETAFCDDSEM